MANGFTRGGQAIGGGLESLGKSIGGIIQKRKQIAKQVKQSESLAKELEETDPQLSRLLKTGISFKEALKFREVTQFGKLLRGVGGQPQIRQGPGGLKGLAPTRIQPTQPEIIGQPQLREQGAGVRPRVESITRGGAKIVIPKSVAERQAEFNIQLEEKTKLGELGRSTQLRRELTSSPIVKDFRTLRRSSKNIDAALADTIAAKTDRGKNIADQALIVGFNKIIDPNSVVRESEFARTPQGLSLVNRIQGFIERVRQGSVGITDEERQDIARIAKSLLNVAGELFNEELNRFGLIADELKVDRKKVLSGFKRFEVEGNRKTSTKTFTDSSGVSFTVEEEVR